MPRLKIVKHPAPVLRARATDIQKVTPRLRDLAGGMIDAMRDAHGLGLAAPQVGESIRMIVVDITQGEAPPLALVNPCIINASAETSIHEEGCLSMPGITAMVRRPSSVTVSALNLDGEERQTEASGLLAVCLQHEIDHLDGVLFIDHVSRLKKEMLTAKYTKLARAAREKALE